MKRLVNSQILNYNIQRRRLLKPHAWSKQPLPWYATPGLEQECSHGYIFCKDEEGKNQQSPARMQWQKIQETIHWRRGVTDLRAGAAMTKTIHWRRGVTDLRAGAAMTKTIHWRRGVTDLRAGAAMTKTSRPCWWYTTLTSSLPITREDLKTK